MKKLFLGHYYDMKIYWDLSASRNQHILITGKSGSGKTNTLLHLGKSLNEMSRSVYFLDYSESFNLKTDISVISILEHPAITHILTQHNTKQDAIPVLLRYSDLISEVWKLGSRQKDIITATLLEMNTHKKVTPDPMNPFYQFLNYDEGKVRFDISFLAYSLSAYHSRERRILADKFLDFVLLTSNKTSPHHQNFIQNNLSTNLYLLKFPPVGRKLNAQVVDLFLWSIFLKNINDNLAEPATIVCDEATLLNWSSSGILTQLLNRGRNAQINLIIATQSLTDDMSKTALNAILQADLHLAFMPPVTDLSLISKSIFQKHSKENAAFLSSLPVGYCFGRGDLCTDKTPTYKQEILIQIPNKEVC